MSPLPRLRYSQARRVPSAGSPEKYGWSLVVPVVVVVVVVVDEVDVVVVDVGAVVVEVEGKLSVDRAGAITGVGSEVATVEPFLFAAATTMRRVDLTSPAVTRYCCPVAPMIGEQNEPALSQRIHWNS